jgi:uroporphyrinogen-III synthase
MRLMGAEHDWRQLLEKYGFDAVLVPPKWALATVLKESPEWRVVDDDQKAILFRRVEKGRAWANENR